MRGSGVQVCSPQERLRSAGPAQCPVAPVPPLQGRLSPIPGCFLLGSVGGWHGGWGGIGISWRMFTWGGAELPYPCQSEPLPVLLSGHVAPVTDVRPPPRSGVCVTAWGVASLGDCWCPAWVTDIVKSICGETMSEVAPGLCLWMAWAGRGPRTGLMRRPHGTGGWQTPWPPAPLPPSALSQAGTCPSCRAGHLLWARGELVPGICVPEGHAAGLEALVELGPRSGQWGTHTSTASVIASPLVLLVSRV